MRSQNFARLVVGLVVTGLSRPVAAQAPAPRQVALDASLLGAEVSYARVTHSGRLVGGGIGAGYDLNIRLVHGEPWGAKSAEVAHFELFERLEPPGHWEYDVGIKAALDVHAAQVQSEVTPGGFSGGYLAPMWGGRHFRIGPRLQAGAYWTSAHPSLGISVIPLTARFLIDF